MRTLSFESHCAAKLQISDSESQKNFILRKQPWTLDEARLNIHVSFCSYRQPQKLIPSSQQHPGLKCDNEIKVFLCLAADKSD